MTYTITFSWEWESQTHSFQCAEDTYLLDAAEAGGFEWPYSSRSGTEPTSAARLISGEVDQSEQSFLDDDQINAGFILTDVAYPLSDCTLVVGAEEQIY